MYGFDPDGSFSELSRINGSDLDGSEWWIGGEIVRTMDAKERKRLEQAGAHLFDNPQKLLQDLGTHVVKELSSCKG